MCVHLPHLILHQDGEKLVNTFIMDVAADSPASTGTAYVARRNAKHTPLTTSPGSMPATKLCR